MDTALWMMKKHVGEEREEEGQGVGSTVLLVALVMEGAGCCLIFGGKGKGKGKREGERKGRGEGGRVRRRVNGE